MANEQTSDFDITEQVKTYNGFITFVTRATIFIIIVLILLALIFVV